jgi:hypothetical protein
LGRDWAIIETDKPNYMQKEVGLLFIQKKKKKKERERVE